MILQKKAPMLNLFEIELDAGKMLFSELAKKIRSKKAILLEEKLFFYQLFLELIGKIHFEEKKLSLKLFSPFDQLYRHLKLVHHVRLIRDAFEYDCDFSSIVWGAWSVAITSIRSSNTALNISSRSAADFMAGFHLIQFPFLA